MIAAAATLAFGLSTTAAHATTIDCKHSGPVVGHPGMEYICYVHHDDAPMEIFYAPGPHP
jgi:hypothetical protein